MAYRMTARFVRPDTATDFPMLTLTDSDYTTRSNNFMTWLGGRSDVTTSTYTSADELTFEFRMDFADQAAADAFTAAHAALDQDQYDPQGASAYTTYLSDNNITYTTIKGEV